MKIRLISPQVWAKLQDVERAKETPSFASDGGGLRVRVVRYKVRNPDPDRGTGDVPELIDVVSCIWQHRYRRPDGKETIKSYGECGIDAARNEWMADRALLDAGIDPLETQQRTRADRSAQAMAKRRAREDTKKAQVVDSDTMKQLIDDWLVAKHSDNPEGQIVLRSRLERHAFPKIGNIPPSQVTVEKVQEVVDAVTADGMKTMPRLIRQYIRSAASWANRHRRKFPLSKALTDPAEWSRVEAPKPRHKHKPPLRPEQIAELWKRAEGAQPAARIAIRLLLLTFVRPSELRKATWSEIDWTARYWRIPAARMKVEDGANFEHWVPLSDEAIRLLGDLREMADGSKFLFPGRDRSRPMVAQAMFVAIDRMKLPFKFTPHACRSTASTWLRNHGFQRDWIECQLSHMPRGTEVEASYNFASFPAQRAKMMAFWSDWIVAGCPQTEAENVVPMRRAS